MEIIKVINTVGRSYTYLRISKQQYDCSVTDFIFSQQSICPDCYLEGQFMRFENNQPVMYCPRCKMSWKVECKEN